MSDWSATGSAGEGGRQADGELSAHPCNGRSAPGTPVRLRLFASAREAAGTPQADMAGGTVGEVLDRAVDRFGPAFAAVLARSRVWVNGNPADASTALAAGDEVAVLPPVSGGAR